MNRIEKRMEELQNKNEKAFVTYMTAGLPDMEGTKALIKDVGGLLRGNGACVA